MRARLYRLGPRIVLRCRHSFCRHRRYPRVPPENTWILEEQRPPDETPDRAHGSRSTSCRQTPGSRADGVWQPVPPPRRCRPLRQLLRHRDWGWGEAPEAFSLGWSVPPPRCAIPLALAPKPAAPSRIVIAAPLG